MTLTKIYQVENDKVVIDLPEAFKNKKQLLITLNDVTDSKIHKLNMLKKAAKYPLFLADVAEINNEFSTVEHENL
ncbi:MAG: hypothetical protein KF781_06620 [Chitinophagaceae bacterium]|nr:hypothetical protein [Chitinophagaceae bacterium]MCW5904106.1 hypothetical protein [Chitinophagaceae bacterium]